MKKMDLFMGFWAGAGLAAAFSAGSILGIAGWGGICVLQGYIAWRDSRPIEIPGWVIHEFLRRQRDKPKGE